MMLDTIVNQAIKDVEVKVSETKIIAAKENIIKYSKKLESDIEKIKKSVEGIENSWQSNASKSYMDTVSKNIEQIENSQRILSGNLSEFFGEVMEQYQAVENIVKKNADMFKK